MYRYFLILIALIAMNIARADYAPLATQLDPDNLALLQPGGPDAMAGLGDWLLSNGTLCAAISDIEHETGFNPWGGALIDVHHCGKDDDQWTFQHALPNLDKDTPLKPTHISASQGGEHAEVVVTAEGYGLQLRSHYQLDSAEPLQLVIKHELIRLREGDPLTMFGLLVLHPHFSLAPFSLSTADPQYSRGFSYNSVDRQDTLSMVEAMNPADTQILVGSPELGQISYGLRIMEATLIDRDGNARQLPQFQVSDPTYSVQGVLSRPPWLGGNGKIGVLEFAQSLVMDVNPGETLRVIQKVYLGDRADVASVSDQIYSGPVVSGKLNTSRAIVHINNAEGHPLTSVKPDGDGKFQAKLPLGSDSPVANVITPWGRSQNIKVSLNAAGNGGKATRKFDQSFIELPRSGPMRLIFKGLGETPDPDFHDNLLAITLDGALVKEIQSANYISLAGIETDKSTVALRPGRYRVLASRGMSFSVTETEITLAAGETLSLKIEPPMREFSTRGWLAADLHVHSAPSYDSYMPVDERLRSFAAQGSDVLVATEHNVLVNYQRDLEKLGLEHTLRVINGVELTGIARTATMPFTNGHLNIFPLTAKPQQFAGGLKPHEGQRLRKLYQQARSENPAVLLQLNHPRLFDPLDPDGDNNYFQHLVNGVAYNSSEPLESETNQSLIEVDSDNGLRDIDFDVMEIGNGSAYGGYKIALEDWFSLLKQGEKIIASANSDTHGSKHLVAIPQNFVKMSQDYEESRFIEAIRQGRVVGSTGPLLDVYASTATQTRVEMGETVGQLEFTLHVSVTAAHWVPVEQVTVYLNGDVFYQQAITRGTQLEVPVVADAGGFIVVEVSAEPDPLYSTVAPGFTPYAFSNPIYIDSQ